MACSIIIIGQLNGNVVDTITREGSFFVPPTKDKCRFSCAKGRAGERDAQKKSWNGFAFLTSESSTLCSCSQTAGPSCADAHGRLSANTFQASTYEAPRALQSCVLGVGEIFACCEELKTLQRFKVSQVGVLQQHAPLLPHDSRRSLWFAVVCV